MAEYSYTGQTISNANTLRAALYDAGETAVEFAINGGNVLIKTTALNESQVNAVVVNATDGTLFANKEVKKSQFRDNTDTYVDVGVETWSTGVNVKLTEKVANGYYEDWQYLTANPSKLSVSQPYIVDTLTGDVDTTTTIGDILTLADNAADRWSSLKDGENDLIILIDAAANQTALDAITDSRS